MPRAAAPCFEARQHGGHELLPTLRPADVHDVIVFVAGKEGAAKDAAGKALRHVLGRKMAWRRTGTFSSSATRRRSSAASSATVLFEEPKQMRTTGEKRDQLRPTRSRRPPWSRTRGAKLAKVVELARDPSPRRPSAPRGHRLHLRYDALGPSGDVVAMEVRTDALQELNERIRTCGGGGGGGGARVTALRIGEHCVPRSRAGAARRPIFICDVLDFVPPEHKETFLLSLRGLLAPSSGRLAVIESRQHWEAHLVDLIDAGFLQKRAPQIVSNRRLMIFEADDAAPPPPPSRAAPQARPEDSAAAAPTSPPAAVARRRQQRR